MSNERYDEDPTPDCIQFLKRLPKSDKELKVFRMILTAITFSMDFRKGVLARLSELPLEAALLERAKEADFPFDSTHEAADGETAYVLHVSIEAGGVACEVRAHSQKLATRTFEPIAVGDESACRVSAHEIFTWFSQSIEDNQFEGSAPSSWRHSSAVAACAQKRLLIVRAELPQQSYVQAEIANEDEAEADPWDQANLEYVKSFANKVSPASLKWVAWLHYALRKKPIWTRPNWVAFFRDDSRVGALHRFLAQRPLREPKTAYQSQCWLSGDSAECPRLLAGAAVYVTKPTRALGRAKGDWYHVEIGGWPAASANVTRIEVTVRGTGVRYSSAGGTPYVGLSDWVPLDPMRPSIWFETPRINGKPADMRDVVVRAILEIEPRSGGVGTCTVEFKGLSLDQRDTSHDTGISPPMARRPFHPWVSPELPDIDCP